MNHKYLIEALPEVDVLHHKDVVVVVRGARMILAQLVKGYEVQIAKDNTLEMLGGVVKAVHQLVNFCQYYMFQNM